MTDFPTIQARYEAALAAFRAENTPANRAEYEAAYAEWIKVAPKVRRGCEGRFSRAGQRQAKEREAQRRAALRRR